jgi:hypothetical protein
MKAKYFSRKGLTRFLKIRPSGKSICATGPTHKSRLVRFALEPPRFLRDSEMTRRANSGQRMQTSYFATKKSSFPGKEP